MVIIPKYMLAQKLVLQEWVVPAWVMQSCVVQTWGSLSRFFFKKTRKIILRNTIFDKIWIRKQIVQNVYKVESKPYFIQIYILTLNG